MDETIGEFTKSDSVNEKPEQDEVTNTSLVSVEERASRLYRGVALAPMVRASTTPLRALALKYGADFCYTEELVDRSLSSSIRRVAARSTERTSKWIDYQRDTSGASAKQLRKLEREGGPPLVLRIDSSLEKEKLVCQIGTGEPELALPAAQKVYKDVSGIDINMGCPKKFSVSGGMGSALLRDPQRASTIIRTLRSSLPETPISCKIRLIQDVSHTLEFCEAMVNAGALAIAIHARQVGTKEMVPADWKMLKEVVTLLKSKHPTLPVLVNGDFYTRQEWTGFLQETGADGVLLARPALYNLSIFRKPSTDESTRQYGYNSPLLLSKTTVIQDYLKECVKYQVHYKNAKYVCCEMMNSRRAPIPRTPFLPQFYPGNQTIAQVCACHSMEAMCKVWDINLSSVSSQKKRVEVVDGRVYDDSYILKKMEGVPQNVADQEPHSKRPKLDTSKSEHETES